MIGILTNREIMKNIPLLVTLLLVAVLNPLSAEQRKKVLPDTVAVAVPDSVDSYCALPVISVGNVSFINGKKELYTDTILVSQSDSTSNRVLIKKQLIDFFVQNVVYPIELRQNAAEDHLKIQFEVDANGRIKNPKVLEAEFPAMAEELLRVMDKMPRYIADYSPPLTCKDKRRDRKKHRKNTTVEIPISFRMLRL